jgi:hypothetical protein
MQNLGKLHHFLVITVEPRHFGFLLHQRQYAGAGWDDRLQALLHSC